MSRRKKGTGLFQGTLVESTDTQPQPRQRKATRAEIREAHRIWYENADIRLGTATKETA